MVRFSNTNIAQDYYPFGMLMPGRSYSSTAYKYGFNGKEKDDEVSGTGNQYDYGFRIYNPRIAKFLSVDPLTKSYPMLTPYQFASNRPIDGIDLDGKEYLNKTTIFYGGVGGSIGDMYGGALEIQICRAHDMIGKTNFIQTVALNPSNQDLYEGSDNPKAIIGLDVGVDFGFEIVSQPTFEKAVNILGVSLPLDEVNFKAKAGFGFGLSLGLQKFGLSLGYGAGFSVKMGDQDEVLTSVSVTYDEADTYIGTSVFYAKRAKLVDHNGTKMYESNVYYRDDTGEQDSGLKVYADAIKDKDGNFTNSSIYKSDSYREKEKKLNNEGK